MNEQTKKELIKKEVAAILADAVKPLTEAVAAHREALRELREKANEIQE